MKYSPQISPPLSIACSVAAASDRSPDSLHGSTPRRWHVERCRQNDMEVPQNGWFIVENPKKWMMNGVPPFQETPTKWDLN